MWAFCFFSIFSQTFVFALNFKLRFQKLLGKAFMMKLLKQILVCKVVTWQPFVPKGRTWFRSGDAGTQQCSGSWIFSSWVVVAGGGTVTFVAQQGTSGFTRCSESAAVTRTFSKPARLLVPFLLLCPFPWLHAANMSSLVLSLRLLLARRTRPQCLPSADKFAWSLPVLLIIFSWQTIAVSSLTQKWHRAAATFFYSTLKHQLSGPDLCIIDAAAIQILVNSQVTRTNQPRLSCMLWKTQVTQRGLWTSAVIAEFKIFLEFTLIPNSIFTFNTEEMVPELTLVSWSATNVHGLHLFCHSMRSWIYIFFFSLYLHRVYWTYCCWFVCIFFPSLGEVSQPKGKPVDHCLLNIC